MSIFDLATLQLQREGKVFAKDNLKLLIDRAITIRKFFDNQERNKKVLENRYRKER